MSFPKHGFQRLFATRGRLVRCQKCERTTKLYLVPGDRIRFFQCPTCGGRLRTLGWFKRRAQALNSRST